MEGGPVRVGFTVSKKVGNSVERNRVRRRLRELVRTSAGVALRSGHDYVLVGRRAALKLPFDRMRTEFDSALRRLERQPARMNDGARPTGARQKTTLPNDTSR